MSAHDESSRQEQLSALIDGELTDAEARELRARIESDPELRRVFESLRRTVDAVRGMDRLAAPVELRAGLRQHTRRTRPILRLFAGVGVGLAAAALLMIAVHFGTESQPVREKFQQATGPEAEKRGESGDDKRRSLKEPDPHGEPTEESINIMKAEAREGMAASDREKEEKIVRDTRPQPGAPAAPAESEVRAALDLEEAMEKRAVLRERIAAGGLLSSGIERSGYLAELSELEGEQLALHFATLESRGRRGFAPTPVPGKGAKKKSKTFAKVPVAAEAQVEGRHEAMLMRKILRSAFPEEDGGEGASKDSGGLQIGGRATEIYVDLDLTPRELTQVHAWLDLLKDAHRTEASSAGANGERARSRGGTKGGAGPATIEPTRSGQEPLKRRVRIRLFFTPQPAPEPAATDDR